MSERLYDYTLQRENGGSQNLYWGNHSKQVTAEELEQMYNADDNARLRESFGSFDNYFAYMNERQDLIDSGEYKADWWNTGQPLVDVEGLGREGGQDDRALEMDIMQEGARQGEIGYNEQADVFNSLYEKYTGESTTKYLDNGAKYEWNGSSFVMTQEAFGPHIGSMVGNAIPGIVLSAGLAGPLGGMLGNATGSTALGKGLAAGVANAGGQYVATGSVDPASALAAGVVAGINPGGTIADKYTPWIKDGAGALGGTGDGFLNGFVSGGVNNGVSQLITTGDLDLQSALQAGVLRGGWQSLQDIMYDADYYGYDKTKARYLADGMTEEQAHLAAMNDAKLWTSDVGAIVGEDGLLPFIPRLNLEPFKNFYEGADGLLGGILPNIFEPDSPVKGWTEEEIENRWYELSDEWDSTPALSDGKSVTDKIAWIKANLNPNWAYWHGTDGLDEQYSWSDNPRGETEIIGSADALVDQDGNIIYTQGTNLESNKNDFGGTSVFYTPNVIAPVDVTGSAAGTSNSAIMNLDAGVTLPSTSATSYWDAMLNGFTEGLLTRTDNGDGTTTVTSDQGSAVVNTDVLDNGLDSVDTSSVDTSSGGDVSTGADVDTGSTGSTGGDGGADLVVDTGTSELPANTVFDTYGNLINTTKGFVIPESSSGSNDELGGTTSDELPAGSGDPTTLPENNYGGQGESGLPPVWSELFGYTKIQPYKKARLKILNDIVKDMGGTGMLTPTLPKNPYMKISRDLRDAGIEA
jgi:hypothetical protein